MSQKVRDWDEQKGSRTKRNEEKKNIPIKWIRPLSSQSSGFDSHQKPKRLGHCQLFCEFSVQAIMTRVAIVETGQRCTLHKTRRSEQRKDGRQGNEEIISEEKHRYAELTDSEEDKPTYFSKRLLFSPCRPQNFRQC